MAARRHRTGPEALLRARAAGATATVGRRVGHSGVRTNAPRWRNRSNRKQIWTMRLVILWTFLISSCTASASTTMEPPRREEHVCREDIDIRNSVNFSKLENCTVIEGSLEILLIDYADSSEYNNLHYPKLLEITDYLLLYRVYGLKTLAHIFPNLSVIRGHRLFFNYAVVAFEMPVLEELGLHSLTHIERGAVRLEKNPSLCYINTIDWSKIARGVGLTDEDHFISQNKDIDECANVCPSDGKGNSRCQSKRTVSPYGEVRVQSLCWSSKHCQIVCEAGCNGSCYMAENGLRKCCNEQCIGGCFGPTAKDCFACKHVLGIEGRCQSRCIATFKFMNRRCILAKDCRNMKDKNRQPWKLHNNECIRDCPSGYIEDEQDRNSCKKCDGPCPRVCLAKVVDSVATAQKLKGCTVINGILEIQIRGGSNIGRELEDSLGLIEKVTAYVKVVRSFALVSLQFLKSLKVIQGDRMFNNRYSLFVLDNQNLQDIWDMKTHPKLTLAQGDVFFYQNSKLCYNKIVEFVKSVGREVNEQNVSPVNNGDQVACNISQMTLEVTSLQSTLVVVKFSVFKIRDTRKLLSYVIYYREAPVRNVTIFNIKDSCGSDDWQTLDVRAGDGSERDDYIAEVIYNLKAWTQYAMYVQTYTVAMTSQGGISKIIYFTTLPTTPTHPRDIKVEAVSPYELKVRWLPPSKPNGNVTHYQVYWQPQPPNQEKLDQRNYCKDRLHLSMKRRKNEVEQETHDNETWVGECCKCPKSEEEEQAEEEERHMQITFENFLHDSVYIKRPVMKAQTPDAEAVITKPNGSETVTDTRTRRIRRSVRANSMNKIMELGNSSTWHFNYTLPNVTLSNDTDEDNSEHEAYLAAVVYGKTEMVLPNLRHFQEYSIEVIACHEPETTDYMSTEKKCSNRAITTGRTLPASNVDVIEPRQINVSNETDGHVRLRWLDPPKPNGLIVMYEIEYGLVSQPEVQKLVRCIPHIEYRRQGGIALSGLPSGNHSFRIRATSLAGNGSWTRELFFNVPERYVDNSMNPELIAGVAVSAFLVLIVIVGVIVWMIAKKRFHLNMAQGMIYVSVNPQYFNAEEAYIPDEWEVSRDKVELIKELGKGSFGMVHEGIVTDLTPDQATLKVAVKTVNENASIRDRIEFLNEASVMKAFNCNHVVKLLGVVSQGQPTMVVMEIMSNGDLKNFLRVHRPDQDDNNGRKPPTLTEVLQMAAEIADGMAYLAGKKFVHRDLAARNCMVSEDVVVKIGDFGMTRDIYETDYYRKGGRGLLPVRWMAPESLKDGIFTSQSDVWGFGVVLWEIATLAAQPYLGQTNEEVLNYVIDGRIMKQPEGCPECLYDLMNLCWNQNPKDRPTFISIIEHLEPNLDDNFREVSYYHSKDRLDREREIEENAAMAAAAANAISVEEYIAAGEQMEKIHTPITGSPCYSLEDLEVESDFGGAMSRHSEDSLAASSHCSHRQSCDCVDIKEKETFRSPKRSPPVSGAVGGAQPPAEVCRDYIETNYMPSSNEGSGSGSSRLHLNGLVNGHVPNTYLSQQRFAEC